MRNIKISANLMIASFLFVVFAAAKTSAQTDSTKALLGDAYYMHSDILDEDRLIMVYTPDEYSYFENRYPVLYLLDGGAHFLHVSGVVQFLSTAGYLPRMIVVALPNVDRTRDLSPVPDRSYPNSGGGDQFLQFVEQEVFPFVETRFRTQPYRIVFGHSLGGTLGLYDMLRENSIFDACIAVSPSVRWGDDYLLKFAKERLHKDKLLHKSVYVTLAGETGEGWEKVYDFLEIAEERGPSAFELYFKNIEGEDHSSAPHLAAYYGLKALYSDWIIPPDVAANGLESIKDYFERLTSKYHYPIEAGEGVLNIIGYDLLRKGETGKAIEIFSFNAEKNPNSANVFDSLGDAYFADKQYDMALRSYRRALDLGVQSNDPNVEIYRANVAKAESKIK